MRRMVRTLGLSVEVSDGCEADDCIASLDDRFGGRRFVVIIGVDRDLRSGGRTNEAACHDHAGTSRGKLRDAGFRKEVFPQLSPSGAKGAMLAERAGIPAAYGTGHPRTGIK